VTPQFDTNRENYGIYFEADGAVLTNLHLNAGFRYDQYADFDPAFSPRAALIYNPVGQSVFKLLYGEAFRAPNVFEWRQNPSIPTKIEPETIRTYEVVYEQGIGNHWRSSVAGFYNEIHNLITFQTASLQYVNLDQVEAGGVELSLEAFWATGVRGRVSYTYQETENEQTEAPLPDSPNHLGKLNLSVPLLKDKLFAGVEVQLASKRTSSHFATALEGEEAPAYGIVNLTLLSVNLVKGLELSASVYNLLDKKYYDPSPQTPGHQTVQDIIEQDGRTWRVKLTYHF
jgi:iron complex outermembrane receptor protein